MYSQHSSLIARSNIIISLPFPPHPNVFILSLLFFSFAPITISLSTASPLPLPPLPLCHISNMRPCPGQYPERRQRKGRFKLRSPHHRSLKAGPPHPPKECKLQHSFCPLHPAWTLSVSSLNWILQSGQARSQYYSIPCLPTWAR